MPKVIRPNIPGYWWYINIFGEIEGALIGRSYGRKSGPLMVFHAEDDGWSDMNHFEKCEVKQWIGIAKPPKLERHTNKG